VVVTDFVVDQLKTMPEEGLERTKAIYNTLTDKLETVAPFLVEEILTTNTSAARINWLTEEKIKTRFESDAFIQRDFFSEYGL
jgi:hypothetical protein